MCRPHRTSGKGILPMYLVCRRRRRRQDRTPTCSVRPPPYPFGFGLFTTDPRRSSTPFYRPLCRLVRMFEIKHAQTLWLHFFVRKRGSGVWTKTVVFEARLAVAFIDLFFAIRFFLACSTSPSRKNEPVPFDRLQTLGNQPGTFRQENDLFLLKGFVLKFVFSFPPSGHPSPLAVLRCFPRSDMPKFPTEFLNDLWNCWTYLIIL